MYFPGTNRFYGWILRIFMNFDHIGKNVIISPSCDIRKKAAPYIYIGNNVSLGKDVWLNIPYEVSPSIRQKPLIKINDGVAIGRRCMITALKSVVIGDNVLFGPGVFVADHSHEFRYRDSPIMKQGVTLPGTVLIEDGCWLGYHCVVTTHKDRDIRIGHNSVVGANAVVTKSFPPHSVLIGNPAQNIIKINS